MSAGVLLLLLSKYIRVCTYRKEEREKALLYCQRDFTTLNRANEYRYCFTICCCCSPLFIIINISSKNFFFLFSLSFQYKSSYAVAFFWWFHIHASFASCYVLQNNKQKQITLCCSPSYITQFFMIYIFFVYIESRIKS